MGVTAYGRQRETLERRAHSDPLLSDLRNPKNRSEKF